MQDDLHVFWLLHVLFGFLLTRKLAARGQWLLIYTNSKYHFWIFSRRRNVALRMTDREVSGVTILEIEGRIVLGEESNSFAEK